MQNFLPTGLVMALLAMPLFLQAQPPAKPFLTDEQPHNLSSPMSAPVSVADRGIAPEWNWLERLGGSSADVANGIVRDNAGNLYVSGTFSGTTDFDNQTLSSFGNSEAFLAKYDPAGNLLWIRRIGSATTEYGVTAATIALGANGQVFVAGSFTGEGLVVENTPFTTDIGGTFVAAFDAAGNLIWLHDRDYEDVPLKMLADAGGSVVVLTRERMFKVGNAGQYVWDNVDQLEGYFTLGSFLLENGVLRVAGSFWYEATIGSQILNAENTGFFLAGVDPATGEVSNAQIIGTSSSPYTDSDRIFAMAAGTAGAVYLAGSFYYDTLRFGACTVSPFAGTNKTFLVKLDPSGCQWLKTPSPLLAGSDNAATGLFTGGDGNVILFGRRFGTMVWDGAPDVLDDSQPGFLLKVNGGTGEALWLRSQPALLAGLVTPAGGIMLAGSDVYDSFFRLTDPDGQTVWSKANAGDGGFGSIVGVEDGPDGVYVFGHVYGNVTFLDAPLPAVTTPSLFVAKTNFAGDHVKWYSLLEGAQARSGSLGQTMVLDPTTGNLICTAIYYDEVTVGSQTFTNDSDPYRSLLVTVHADGTFGGAVDLGVSGVTGLAVDPEGKIVVGGVFDGELQLGSTTLTEAGQSDAFIARYDPDGSLLWAKRLGGSDIEYSLQVAADAQSNIYFTSEIYSDAVDFDGQPLLAQGDGDGHILNGKLNPDGNLAWLKVHGSTDDPGEETACFPGGFTADAAGNTYMSGFFGRSNFFGNIHLTSPYTLNNFLGKFDPSGNPLWVSPILTKRFSINYAELDLDAEGNCYTNGLIRDSVFFGNILVTPHPALFPRDAFLAKYAGDDGAFEWVKTLYGNVGRLQALAVPSEESILVGGTFTDILYSDDEVLNAKGGANGFVGLLGDDILVSTAEVEAGKFLLGIYPNPAAGRVYLQVQDPAAALVEVVDVRGAALVQRSLEAHELDRAIDLALLPDGIYFVRITMNGRTDVRRVVME